MYIRLYYSFILEKCKIASPNAICHWEAEISRARILKIVLSGCYFRVSGSFWLYYGYCTAIWVVPVRDYLEISGTSIRLIDSGAYRAGVYGDVYMAARDTQTARGTCAWQFKIIYTWPPGPLPGGTSKRGREKTACIIQGVNFRLQTDVRIRHRGNRREAFCIFNRSFARFSSRLNIHGRENKHAYWTNSYSARI